MCKKHIIITGGNSGIGFQAALQVSFNENCLVTIICRNKGRAEKYVIKKPHLYKWGMVVI